MIKMRQVAERAGVSAATVSRVMSGSTSVAPEYRDRVLRAVAELGYRPNRLASNLRRRTTETIGVVVSEIENPHFTEMVRTVEEAAYERGLRVILCNTDERPGKQEDYLRVLADEQVVGVLLVPTDPAGAEIGRLLDAGIPVVAFDRGVADPRAEAVVVDNVGGVRQATDRLILAGHERIGFVGGLTAMQTGAERLIGYRAAIEQRGLTPRTVDGAFRIEGGEDAASALLDVRPPVSAMVVANNLMTIGVLRTFRRRGVRVPEDVALVTVDDPPWAELVDPPLTTLAQPVGRMAEAAARLLFERIDGSPSPARSLIFDFELRIRRSCGTDTTWEGDRA